jgi:hypothetical protein
MKHLAEQATLNHRVPGSSPGAPTIQSHQTADLHTESKQAVSVGIFAGIVPLFRSPVVLPVSQAEFSLPSPHPKIPFPAVGLRPPRSSRNSGILGAFWTKTDAFEPGPCLSWVQPEGFELLTPFCRSITESLDSNAAGQTTFDGSAHEIWREERK